MRHQQAIQPRMAIRSSEALSTGPRRLPAIAPGTQVLIAFKDLVHLLPTSGFCLELADLLKRQDLKRTLLVPFPDRLQWLDRKFGDVEKLGLRCAVDHRFAIYNVALILLHDGKERYQAYEYKGELPYVELRSTFAKPCWDLFMEWAEDSLERLES